MKQLYCSLLVVALTFLSAPLAFTAETRDEERARILGEMRELAEGTQVEIVGASEPAKLVENPVFRYDDQPRRLLDATVWAWTRDGRPVAFQKIEAMGSSVPQWQYCFSSLAEDRLKVQWTAGKPYESTQPGVEYVALTKSPAVAERTIERRRQLREMARAFSARSMQSADNFQEMRLLTTPLFEFYNDANLLQGAVFAYSANGTNPDLLIAMEARPVDDIMVWHYAPARMTVSGVTVKHLDQTVWECPFIPPGKNAFETWTYFQTRRNPPAP